MANPTVLLSHPSVDVVETIHLASQAGHAKFKRQLPEKPGNGPLGFKDFIRSPAQAGELAKALGEGRLVCCCFALSRDKLRSGKGFGLALASALAWL